MYASWFNFDACQFELAGILVLENVNKLQHFEVRLHFLALKCSLTQVRLPCESNQLAKIVRMTTAFQQVIYADICPTKPIHVIIDCSRS